MNSAFRPPFVAAVALGFLAASLPGLVLSFSGERGPRQQSVGRRAPLRPINSINGKDLYKAYCEQCHGAGGKGDGPAGASLKRPPADLTQLAARNSGKFNRTGVERFIKGDRPGGVLRTDTGTAAAVIINADGTPDYMPVYGILFREVWPDEPVIIRCGNLARYIESIQAK
jgi:hypothetical protein